MTDLTEVEGLRVKQCVSLGALASPSVAVVKTVATAAGEVLAHLVGGNFANSHSSMYCTPVTDFRLL